MRPRSLAAKDWYRTGGPLRTNQPVGSATNAAPTWSREQVITAAWSRAATRTQSARSWLRCHITAVRTTSTQENKLAHPSRRRIGHPRSGHWSLVAGHLSFRKRGRVLGSVAAAGRREALVVGEDLGDVALDALVVQELAHQDAPVAGRAHL